MATVNVNITINGSGATGAAQQVVQSLNNIQNAARRASGASAAAARHQDNVWFGVARRLRTFATTYLILRAILATVNAISTAIAGIVKGGIEFNSFMEDAQIALTGIVLQTQRIKDNQGRILEGEEKYAAAVELAADQLERIRVLGLKTSLTSEEIVQGFQGLLGPMSQAGVELENAAQLTTNIALAMKAAGIPARELSQEGRAILNGEISRNARLNQILRVTKQELAEWKKRDIVFEQLNLRMAGYVRAAKEAEGAWSTLKSNVVEVHRVSSGQALKGFFDEMKLAAHRLQTAFIDLATGQIQPEMLGGLRTLGELGRWVGREWNKTLNMIIDGFRRMMLWVEANGTPLLRLYFAWTAIWDQVAGLVGDIFHIFTGIRAASDAGAGLEDIFVVIAGSVLAIRLALLAVIGTVKLLATLIIGAIWTPIRLILLGIGKIADAVGLGFGRKILDFVDELDQNLVAVAKSGVDTFKRMGEAVDEFGQKALAANDAVLTLPNRPKRGKPDFDTESIGGPEEDDNDKRLKQASDYWEQRFRMEVENLRMIGQENEAALLELRKQYAGFFAQAVALGDKEGIKIWERFFNLTLVRQRADDLMEELQRIQARLQARLQGLDVGLKLGTITPGQARLRTLQEYTRVIGELETKLKELETLSLTLPFDEEIKEQIEDTRLQIIQLRFEVDLAAQTFVKFSEDANDALQKVVNQGLDSIIDGTRSVSQAFGDMVRGMIRQLASLIQQILVAYAAQQLLGAIGLAVPQTIAFGKVSNIPGKASGGLLGGVGGPRDDANLFWGSKGEYVVQAASVEHYGKQFLDLLNNRRLPRNVIHVPRFRDGGLIGGEQAGGVVEHRFHGLIELEDGVVMRTLESREGDKWFITKAKRHRQAIRGLAKS